MKTLPSCTQTNHLAPAAQIQALTTIKPSEPSRAAQCHLHRGADDPDSARQVSAGFDKDTTATLASAVPPPPPGTSDQPGESVQRRLSEASEEASSPSTQSVVLPQLPPSTLNQSINAQQSMSVHSQLSTSNRQTARSPSAHSAADCATGNVTDSVMDSFSLGSSASDAAWQHHICRSAGHIEQDGLAGQGTLASAKDGLVDSWRSASACNMANIACSQSSTTSSQASHSHSSSSSSDGSSSSSDGSCSKGSSLRACSEGQANPAPSGGAVPVSPSAEACNATLLCTDEAEDNKQLLTSAMLANSNQEVPALAPSNESVILDSSATDDVNTSTASSSASADVQASPAVAQDTSDSIAGSSVVLQTTCSRAEHAQSSLFASTSSTEAHPTQAGLPANAPAGAGHDDFRDNAQHKLLLGTSEALRLAEMHACPASQLITTSTGLRQAGESAQLGVVLIGHSVSMTDMLPEARVQAAATAEGYDAQTEHTHTGMQTDASMLACKRQVESKSCCSAPSGGVKVQADTQSAESAELASISDLGLVAGSAAKQEAARHQSLPNGPAAESAHDVCVSGNGASSSDADAEASAMHSCKADGIAISPGEQLCMSNVDAIQSDHGITADSQPSMHVAMPQTQPAMLGLVTACGGHDSLKELIRADKSCFSYEKDCLLMSVVEQIRGILT